MSLSVIVVDYSGECLVKGRASCLRVSYLCWIKFLQNTKEFGILVMELQDFHKIKKLLPFSLMESLYEDIFTYLFNYFKEICEFEKKNQLIEDLTK